MIKNEKSKEQKHWKNPKPWTPKVALRPSGVLLVSRLVIFFTPCHKSDRSVLLLPWTHLVQFCHSLGFGTTEDSGDS